MVTTELAGRVGITHTTACEVLSREDKVERQKEIARYQTGRGVTALVVLLMDLLVSLDPR